MPRAEQVARALAYEFLKNGNFTAATGPEHIPSLAGAVAAAGDDGEPEPNFAGFAGLAVQSVGFDDGDNIQNPRVHIYLTRGSMRLIRSLPGEISGVPVTAHQMGPVSVRPEKSATATNRGNFYTHGGRVCCGSSCAPTSENYSGTLGALVRLRGGNQFYLLSNNHVLAGCNHVPKDQPILSPSNNDSRPDIPAPGEVGRHDRIQELRSGSPNFVGPCDLDVALARATNIDALSSWQGDADHGYDTPAQIGALATGQRVKKFGRTTGLTTGNVEARIGAPMPVTYQSKHFKGTVWFKDVWTVISDSSYSFALPGDSGSVVVTQDGAEALGLVFAANTSGDYAWLIPLSAIRAAFPGLQLVHGHGV